MLVVILFSVFLSGLLAMKADSRQRAQAMFEQALQSDDLDSIKNILANPLGRVDPSVHGNLALIKACIGCDADLVRTLVRHSRVPLDEVDPLVEAVKYGCLNVVKMLLREARIEPARNGSNVLREAIQKGHLKIVKALLEDKRVQPTDQHSICLVDAVTTGHIGILQALLLDGRADPKALGSRAMSLAASLGRDAMVSLLLVDGRASVDAALATATGPVMQLFAGLPESMYEETNPEYIDEDMLEWTTPLQLDILIARARNNRPMLLKLFLFKIKRIGLDSVVYRKILRRCPNFELLRLSSLEPAALKDELFRQHQ